MGPKSTTAKVGVALLAPTPLLSLYLELFLKISSTSFSHCIQLIEGNPEVGCCHFSISTHHQLSQGIMDKCTEPGERLISNAYSLWEAMSGMHTCVCTIFMRWPRRLLRNWYTLRLPSDLICCIMMKLMRDMAFCGTPWSGQAV